MGRFLAGIACGLNATIIPIYLKQFTPPVLRSKTGTFIQIFSYLGSFLCVCLGIMQPIYSLDTIIEDKNREREIAWRLTLGVPILMCITRLLCLYFVYKQPTPNQMSLSMLFSIYKSCKRKPQRKVSENSENFQQDYAKQSDIFQSQGRNQNESMANSNMKAEVDFIRTTSLNRSLLASDDIFQTEIYNSFSQKKSCKIQRSKNRRFKLCLIVQTASRVSGLSALTFYSSLIFSEQIKDQSLNYILIVFLGLSGFIFTYLSFFFQRKDRKKGAYTSKYGQGGVTWPNTTELVNQEHVSYCSAMRWEWVLVIGVIFPFTNQLLGLSRTFFTYLGAAFLCFLYFLKELKETKVQTKEQMESLYC
ncbi:hypothetical protein ABPG72_007715 [Tetrahymena utriculariae]